MKTWRVTVDLMIEATCAASAENVASDLLNEINGTEVKEEEYQCGAKMVGYDIGDGVSA